MSDFAFLPVQDLPRRVSYPPARVWLKHLFWFLLTFVTTTLTGSVPIFSLERLLPQFPDPETWQQTAWLIFSIPSLYLQAIETLLVLLYRHPELLRDGLIYSTCLLFILTCHEAGHYIACRIYNVEATLPLFLPSPPLIALGTFGAFIRILSPLPSRKAIFDIGVAGPIAGFIALLPVAVIGIFYAQPVPSGETAQYVFSDPLLLRLMGWMMGVDVANSYTNPFYTVAWIGLLVTSLNLIPSGQLDGGHAVYAVFGKRFHTLMGRVAFVSMLTTAILGIIYYNSPSGILFVIILAIMLRIGHPTPLDETPLDLKRRIVAFITLVIFVLSFVPFPIQINLF
jgi:membrane-associated protease RseP (regulator of RpoE activity)